MRPEPLTDDELAEIKERAHLATPGPWAQSSEGIVEAEQPQRRIVALTCKGSNRMTPLLPAFENATFIAHARTDVLRLIAEVERLQCLLDARSHPPHDLVER